MGHKSYECPNPNTTPENAAVTAQNASAVNNVHIGNRASSDSDGDDDDDNSNLEFSFYTKDQDGKERTPDTWVLLDNQSTVDFFSN